MGSKQRFHRNHLLEFGDGSIVGRLLPQGALCQAGRLSLLHRVTITISIVSDPLTCSLYRPCSLPRRLWDGSKSPRRSVTSSSPPSTPSLPPSPCISPLQLHGVPTPAAAPPHSPPKALNAAAPAPTSGLAPALTCSLRRSPRKPAHSAAQLAAAGAEPLESAESPTSSPVKLARATRHSAAP